MIKEMHISNYALLNEVKISFDSGYNVLTGSTGTGKSILINALSLLLGEKGDVDSIRKEEDRAVVEGIFTNSDEITDILKSHGLPEDNELVIRRSVLRKGGGSVYINGSLANLRILEEIGRILFDIHGQHEHQRLINEETHIDFLDSYGQLNDERQKITNLYHNIRELKNKLNRKIDEKNRISERKELYEYQKKELESLKFSPEEYEEIKNEKKVLDNFEEISRIVEESIAKIGESEESILDILGELTDELENASKVDNKLSSISERIKESNLILQDAILDLSRYRDSMDYDKNRLSELNDIITNIENLKKKFGKEYGELIEYRKEISGRIFNIEELSREIVELNREIENQIDEMEKLADILSDKRKDISIKFAEEVEQELIDLGFERAHFKVQIEKKSETDETGKDKILFLFEPNVGEGWKPLSSIASGGELSRVMLALKSILSDVDRVEGIVFDEVDVGIGGSLARKVGEKMKVIGKRRQVLCVTHLPNIASLADYHIKIDKKTSKGRTVTTVIPVKGKKRIEEIARMISGDSSKETAIEHARELLKTE